MSAAGGLQVGSISARLGARFDDADVTRYERRLIAVRRLAATPINTQLDATAVQGDFDQYEQLIRQANAQAGGGANADLTADVDRSGFNDFDAQLDQARQNAGDAGTGAGDAMGGGFLAKLKGFAAPIAAAGAALGAVFFKAVTDAVDREELDSKLAAQLDLNPEETKKAGKLTGRIYANAYGESLEEVQGTVRSVVANLNMSLDDVQTERVSEKLLNLASTFGTEADEVTRAISSLMQNGLAANVDEALDIITSGFTSGADRSGEFLDTLNEYAAPLASLGISANDFSGIINEGFERGVYSADKLGDALKEFSIRAIDGSEATKDGYKAIGMEAERTAEIIANGGPKARDATREIIDRILAIKDATKRDAAGVAFFGSMWEDLKAKGIGALRPVKDAVDDVEGAAKRMNDTLSGTKGAAWTSFKREVENAMASAGDSIIRFGVKAKDTLTNGYERAVESVSRSTNGTVARLRRTWDQGMDTIRDAIRTVRNAISSVFGGEGSEDLREFGRAVGRVASIVADGFSRIARFVGRMAKDALPELGQAFRGVLTVIRGVMKIITGILTMDFAKTMDGLADVGRGALKALGAVFKAAVNPIGAAVGAIGDAVGDKLSSAWRSAMRTAASFVNSLIGIINKIPGVDLKPVTWGSTSDPASVKKSDDHERKVAGFRAGGEVIAVSSGEAMRYPDGSWAMVPGPRVAADNVLTWAPYDTEVYTEDGIRRLGEGKSREETLRTQRRHFADGGVFGRVHKAAGDLLKATPVGQLVDSAASLVGELPEAPGGLVGGALKYARDKAVAYIKSKASSLLGGGMGDNDPRWNELNALAASYGNVVTSALRPGDDGWHGQGRARDYAGGDMLGLAKAFASKFGSRLLELIHTPLGYGIKNGKRIASFGKAVDDDHFDHVHAAFGLGGLLRVFRDGGANKKKAFDPWDQYKRAETAAKRIGKLDDFDPLAAVRETDPRKKKAKDKAEAQENPTRGKSTIMALAAQSRASKKVDTWLTNALKITGKWSGANFGALKRRTMQESRGNPRAVNNWDSNAKKGTPSKGMLQVIQPTFDRYKLPVLGNDIFDVAANPVAAIRYMYGEYGRVVDAGSTGYGLGGLVQAFRRGGRLGVLQGKIDKKSSARAAAQNEGVARSVARAEKGIAGYEGKIQKLENDYSLTDREFAVEPLELLIENEDGSATPNTAAINRRLEQLSQLRAKRQRIMDTITEYRLAIARLIEELRESIKKLQRAIKATAGKSRQKVRDGYQAQIGVYRERISELEGTDSDLADDYRGSSIDLAELQREASEVDGKSAGVPAPPKAADDSPPPPAPGFDDLLTDDERKSISEVERDESLAKLTQSDPADDEAARKRGEDLYRGILKRLQDSGAAPEVIKSAADALAGYLPTVTAPDATPSPADLARAVEEQVRAFLSGRADLLSQLGSNVSDFGGAGAFIGGAGATGLDVAAGGSNYGYRGTARTGAQVYVEALNQHFPQAPENIDAWRTRVGYSTAALLP